MSNHYVATLREFLFRNASVAARAAANGGHLLPDRRLAFQRIDGSREEHALPNAHAMISALKDVFGIDVPDHAAIAEAFACIGAA